MSRLGSNYLKFDYYIENFFVERAVRCITIKRAQEFRANKHPPQKLHCTTHKNRKGGTALEIGVIPPNLKLLSSNRKHFPFTGLIFAAKIIANLFSPAAMRLFSNIGLTHPAMSAADQNRFHPILPYSYGCLRDAWPLPETQNCPPESLPHPFRPA